MRKIRQFVKSIKINNNFYFILKVLKEKINSYTILFKTYFIFYKIIFEYTIPAIKGIFYSIIFPIIFLYYTIPVYGMNFCIFSITGYYISMFILYNTLFNNKKSANYFYIGILIVSLILLLLVPF